MLISFFKNSVLKYGNAIAAKDKYKSISYAELDRQSDQIATYLIENYPLSHKTVINICNRSINSLVGMLGILKSGCRYVAIEYPCTQHEIDIIVNALEHDVILFSDNLENTSCSNDNACLVSSILAKIDKMPVSENLTEGPHTYICFTSGSTGKPKGVVVNGSAIGHYIKSLGDKIALPDQLQYGYVSSLSTDLGNTVLFLALASGGTIHLIDNYTRRDPGLLWKYFCDNRVNFIKTTPSHFKSLMGHSDSGKCDLHYLLLGGEIFEKELARDILGKKLVKNLYNHYGPTETTIGVATFKVTENVLDTLENSRSIPVGGFFGQNKYLLINRDPKTNTGELYIGGPQLADSYHNDPENTGRSFVKKDEDYYYKTGDLVKEHPNSVIEFLGRIDRQVKIRGYRIELEHVEVASRKIEGITYALAFTEKFNSRLQLILAVKSENKSKIEIFSALQTHLPKFMLPDDIFLLEDVPLKSSGKAHQAEIINSYKQSKASMTASTSDAINAFTGDKLLVYQEWIRLFGSAHEEDEFFACGGDSIEAIEFISKLQSAKVNITAKQFLDNPTIKGILESISQTSTLIPFHYSENFTRFHPVQQWYFEKCSTYAGWFNQSICLTTIETISKHDFHFLMGEIVNNHPSLRTRYQKNEDGVTGNLVSYPTIESYVAYYDDADTLSLQEIANMHQQLVCENSGVLAQFVFVKNGEENHLIVIIHHLAVDGISWRILIDEIIRGFRSIQLNLKIDLHEVSSYTQWVDVLYDYSVSEEFFKDKEQLENDYLPKIIEQRASNVQEKSALKDYKAYELIFPLEETTAIESRANALDCPFSNYLLACCAELLFNVANKSVINIDIENHGREHISDSVDISRTIGWFTSIFPINLKQDKTEKLVEQLSQYDANNPKKGLAYGVWKYLNSREKAIPQPDFCFNFLGKLLIDVEFNNKWFFKGHSSGQCRNLEAIPSYGLIITSKIIDKKLYMEVCFDTKTYDERGVVNQLTKLKSFLTNPEDTSAPSHSILVESPQVSMGQITYFNAISLDVKKTSPMTKQRKKVILTGASGFVGSYILKSLIDDTDWDIICILREGPHGSLEKHLQSRLKHYFPSCDADELLKRVTILPAQLERGYFGLNLQLYEELADSVDLIIHSAADVNLFKSQKLESNFNIMSVKEVIRFANAKKKKQIHHISTLAICGYMDEPEDRVIFSEADLDIGQRFNNSYEESKFHAEKLLKEELSNGGSVYIYRLGNITADSQKSIYQINSKTNRIYQMLASYLLVKAVPSNMEPFSLTHVDTTAQAIVKIASSDRVKGGTIHIDNPQMIDADALIDYFKSINLPVEKVDKEEYLSRLSSVDFSDFSKLSAFWSNRKNRNIKFVADKSNHILADHGISYSNITSDWLKQFIIKSMPELQSTIFSQSLEPKLEEVMS
ncbi:AMP-binding protein [Parachlamydia acanthamoebae]|uniref:Carrier domain-containing protein n=1 Tax=Parachlamydia acanthamoebae TaxID=83552 RepID=A0A0C1BZ10_9BACT|nr:AMP-binding protein [Parachlamydia acanthamoebae]KIA76636.1 hypothetical protein DB43_AA00610 [Parachlamydia acanthamoebae]